MGVGNKFYFDNLSGEEFEKFLKRIFENSGYTVELTPKTGDYGADLIIYKEQKKIVVQAKRYSEPVGVSAIQEIIGAISYYNADSGMVVTSNYYTPNAANLAASANILLWNRDNLIKQAIDSFNPDNNSEYKENEPHVNVDILSMIENLDSIHHLLIFGPAGSGKSSLLHSIAIKLLQSNNIKVDIAAELRETAFKLIDTLRNFGLITSIIDINREPTITRYEVQPHPDVVISKITDIADDIAHDLAVSSIHIESVPNKPDVLPSVWIEIPNKFDSLKLIIIDTKMVEFNAYNGVPQLIIPVLTDTQKSTRALAWVISEMRARYKLFAEHFVRSRKEYNDLIVWNKIQGLVIPQIVIVIDELQDLIAAAKADVENSLSEIALKGSKAGIHIIAATQNVQIEKNLNNLFPSLAHLSIKQHHMVELRNPHNNTINTILPFTEWNSITEVITELKSQNELMFGGEVQENTDSYGIAECQGSNTGYDKEDEMLSQAIECVVEAGMASTAQIQRRLKIGYARAARIIDQLEERGIVGPFIGSSPRQVLLSRARWAEMKQVNIEINQESKCDTSATIAENNHIVIDEPVTIKNGSSSNKRTLFGKVKSFINPPNKKKQDDTSDEFWEMKLSGVLDDEKGKR